MSAMTKEALLDICKQNDLYRTPSLNDKLYCNFKGFSEIACLEEYINVKALFLEGNVLESLDGLPTLKELKCLYVQQNCIWKISNLEALENLDTINISNNQLTSLEGLACCKALRTLIATHNHLATLESVQALAGCQALQTVDLQSNELTDPGIVDVLKQIPDLRCLYLKGNPVVSNIKNYRKALIASIPSLTYLDDRPVSDTERKVCVAWLEGGLDAERAMRNQIKEEEEERTRKNHEFMMQMRAQGWRERRKRLGLPEGDTDPALEDFSDGEYEFDEEPQELVDARQRLAAYTARPGEEEPADVASTRQQLASGGRPIVEGQWRDNSTEDSQIYLDSVKAAQAELNLEAGATPQEHTPLTSPSGSEGTGGGLGAAGKTAQADTAAKLDVCAGSDQGVADGSTPGGVDLGELD
ncbi:Leucine-rich repeat-containing protein ODA7 [Tetrabaena socialis]|uniref:Leucine-rich repeat-containing protein ODA7 n=1 Tax=Tetrabaena socialis TaxID=47790 RepID=A0A2J8AD65_9CHLO|nr:Leucine-rich repeat-containing protein ODA7 [Tetrabaena socialis]|eukprot:PNH10461.1 Leucine-rich repeat-containing protein ODA7 [Tetrabaena socialis]